MSELKPCPLCDSERLECDVYIRDGRAVHCKDCGCSVHAYEPGAREKSIEKWNRRSAISPTPAPSTAPVGMTEGQREALELGADALEEPFKDMLMSTPWTRKYQSKWLKCAKILRALANGG